MNAHPRTISVVLADDHPIVLLAIADQFSKLPSYCIAATVNSGAELARAVEKESVDLIITDLVMQGDEKSNSTVCDSSANCAARIRTFRSWSSR